MTTYSISTTSRMNRRARMLAGDLMDRLNAAMRVANTCRVLPIHVRRCEWAMLALADVLQCPRKDRPAFLEALHRRIRRLKELEDHWADQDSLAAAYELEGLGTGFGFFAVALMGEDWRLGDWYQTSIPAELDPRFAREIEARATRRLRARDGLAGGAR